MEFRRHQSIASIPADIWDRLIPGQVENWAYYRASEPALPEGFRAEYLTVMDDALIVGVAPVFHTYHYLHVSLSGRMRRIADALSARAPWLFRMGVTGLGSAVVDRCHVGIRPDLSPSNERAVYDTLLKGLHACSKEARTSLLVIKDADDKLADTLRPYAQGFARIRSLPNVYLDLPFDSWQDFLKSHTRRTSTYIARKEKQSAEVVMEVTSKIDGLGPEIYQLFEQTRRQAIGDYGDFEKLHPDYFSSVACACQEARFLLGRIDGQLVSFLFFMHGNDEVVWNFIGMTYPQAREHNLYFVSINHLIRYCINHQIPRLRMGNTSYAPKLMYGGKLATHWVYLKHKSPVMNLLFHRFAPAFDYVSNDAELSRLQAEGKLALPPVPTASG